MRLCAILGSGSTPHPVAPVRASLAVLWCALSLAASAGPAGAASPSFERNMQAPSFTTSSLVLRDGEEPPLCDSPDCARRKLDARATVRLSGEFGSFTGRVAHWAPDSLSGFDTDPEWGGQAPAGGLHWAQVQRVDKRVGNTSGGAVTGGILGGLLGALVGGLASAPVEVVSLGTADTTPQIVGSIVVGALIGAGIGAAAGSSSTSWKPVYRRP